MPQSCAIPDCPDPADASYIGVDPEGQPWTIRMCEEHFRLAVATAGMTDEEAEEWVRNNPRQRRE